MIVKPFDHGLDLLKPAEGYVRTEGLHASDLYGSFHDAVERKPAEEREGGARKFSSDAQHRMGLGLAFEEVLERALVERFFGSGRPGEMVSPEGVIYSPDFLFFEDDETILGEFKVTWKSSKGAPHGDKFARWRTQCALYCNWLGITRTRLFAFFVNGNYKPMSPQLKAWELEFTPTELSEEWDTVRRHAITAGILTPPKRRRSS